MRHVLDLDGDWFAMPPCRSDAHSYVVEGAGECVWCHPHVGDVLANVRTHYTHHSGYHPVWADPPFLRVVEVLPLRSVLDPIDDRDEVVVGRDGRTWYQTAEISLPNAFPGGWAVRVESATDYDGYLTPEERERPPAVDGPPLNKGDQQ